MRAALGQPGGEREQRRGARADPEQQARGRVAGHRERAAERPDHVEDVTGAAVREPLGARLARQEHELHGAAVVGPHVVDRERAPREHAGLRAADGDRDELAGPEPGGDRRGDHGHGDVSVHPAHREDRPAHLNRRRRALPVVPCHPAPSSPLSRCLERYPDKVNHQSPGRGPSPAFGPSASPAPVRRACHRTQPRSAAACSCRERTPISPRMVASMPCTAAASPATVVTHGTPRRTAAVLIS